MKLRIEPLARTMRRVGPLPTETGLPPGIQACQLNVAVETQWRSNWCWAAITCAISAHYGDTSWQQDKLAWRILCADQVKPNTPPPAALLEQELYNQQAALERTLRYVNCLNGWSGGRPPFRRLIRELDEGRPLAVAIRWQSGSQHYVLVDGYCRHLRKLFIADPQSGRSAVVFDDFPTNYRHGGEWMETYWTHNPYLASRVYTGEPQYE